MPNHNLPKNIYFETIRSVVQLIMTCLKDSTFLLEVKGKECTITDSSFCTLHLIHWQ
jgi:hypothetical protein